MPQKSSGKTPKKDRKSIDNKYEKAKIQKIRTKQSSASRKNFKNPFQYLVEDLAEQLERLFEYVEQELKPLKSVLRPYLYTKTGKLSKIKIFSIISLFFILLVRTMTYHRELIEFSTSRIKGTYVVTNELIKSGKNSTSSQIGADTQILITSKTLIKTLASIRELKTDFQASQKCAELTYPTLMTKLEMERDMDKEIIRGGKYKAPKSRRNHEWFITQASEFILNMIFNIPTSKQKEDDLMTTIKNEYGVLYSIIAENCQDEVKMMKFTVDPMAASKFAYEIDDMRDVVISSRFQSSFRIKRFPPRDRHHTYQSLKRGAIVLVLGPNFSKKSSKMKTIMEEHFIQQTILKNFEPIILDLEPMKDLINAMVKDNEKESETTTAPVDDDADEGKTKKTPKRKQQHEIKAILSSPLARYELISETLHQVFGRQEQRHDKQDLHLVLFDKTIPLFSEFLYEHPGFFQTVSLVNINESNFNSVVQNHDQQLTNANSTLTARQLADKHTLFILQNKNDDMTSTNMMASNIFQKRRRFYFKDFLRYQIEHEMVFNGKVNNLLDMVHCIDDTHTFFYGLNEKNENDDEQIEIAMICGSIRDKMRHLLAGIEVFIEQESLSKNARSFLPPNYKSELEERDAFPFVPPANEVRNAAYFEKILIDKAKKGHSISESEKARKKKIMELQSKYTGLDSVRQKYGFTKSGGGVIDVYGKQN